MVIKGHLQLSSSVLKLYLSKKKCVSPMEISNEKWQFPINRSDLNVKLVIIPKSSCMHVSLSLSRLVYIHAGEHEKH